jgi:large subunit ribosomal protein L6
VSRIGKLPITIPSGVTITVDGGVVTVNGSKGSLSQAVMPGITVKEEEGQILVTRPNDDPENRANHGLMRALINNMVQGVSSGFSKKLEVQGVGFRVALQGSNLNMKLGFSHDVNFAVPQGVTAGVEQNVITVSGIDKQQVGQVAAEIAHLRRPDAYKGKGIKYQGERLIRKAGKTGKGK